MKKIRTGAYLMNGWDIFIFSSDSKGIDPEELLEHDVEYISLEGDGNKLSIANLVS